MVPFYLIAKTSNSDRGYYLPISIHLQDTEQVIAYLFTNWLSEAVKREMAGSMSDDDLMRFCRFLALVHDIGKATPCFQSKVVPLVEGAQDRYMQDGYTWKFRPVPQRSHHAIAGEAILETAGCPDTTAEIIGAHHGKPASSKVIEEALNACGQGYGCEDYYGDNPEKWEETQRTVLDDALRQTGYASAADLPEVSLYARMMFCGLLIMADWLASNTDFFPLIPVDEAYSVSYRERAEFALEKIKFPKWEPEYLWSSDGLCEARFRNEQGIGYTPNAAQREMMHIAESMKQPGLMILEAQMGVGKTEAALLAAEILACGMNDSPRRSGIFFGLPTQATANGIFSRVKEWAATQTEYAPATIRLAHGAAEMNEVFTSIHHSANVEQDGDGSGLIVHDWFMGRKQVLLSDFVIGTVDQFLMSALKQKHVMLRHLGLGNKVVIIDEVHAYDAYMSKYLDEALAWMGAYGVPVILLSATLPPVRRKELVQAYLGKKALGDGLGDNLSYPLLTWTEGTQAFQKAIPNESVSRIVRMEYVEQGDEDEYIVNTLREKLKDGGCAGVIVNTVRRAQTLTDTIKRSLPDRNVLLLHAQFTLEDRKRHEDELLRRIGKGSGKQERDGLIVIGTQVIEQSLDIDFDYLVTDLCPMDLLLQRLGRLHRHSCHDGIRPQALRTPACLVLGASEKPEPGSAQVYGEYLLMRTRAFLPEAISLPGDIPRLVHDVYDESVEMPAVPEGYEKTKEKYALQTNRKRNNAKGYLMRCPKVSAIPGRNTLHGLLDDECQPAEVHAQAAVRDGDPSIDVIVLVRYNEDEVGLAGFSDVQTSYPLDHVPCEKDSKRIMENKLRLPHSLCHSGIVDQTISELKEYTRIFEEWKQSAWLRDGLFLLLDETGTAMLCGFHLTYDSVYGLKCIKEETHEGKGIQPDR